MRGVKNRKSKRRRAGGSLLLPEDALHDCARATLIGRGAVLVEGQHGVVELGAQRLRLRTGLGILTIVGSGLSLGALSPDAAMIHGEIETIAYGREARKGE